MNALGLIDNASDLSVACSNDWIAPRYECSAARSTIDLLDFRYSNFGFDKSGALLIADDVGNTV